MANDLFDLFRDNLKTGKELVATEPHTLESISELEEHQELVLEKIAALEEVELKVDYSDFSNFVFFNSALDYFNITGEKILNEYPFDGTVDEIERFTRNFDGYQRHVLDVWPKSVGHLRFNTSISSSYILIDDVGREAGVSRGGVLSPGTGSFSIELWMQPGPALTGTEDVQVLVQKVEDTTAALATAYSLFLSGSNIHFVVKSGSVRDSVSTPFTPGRVTFVSAVLDRASFTGSLIVMTGSQTEFPVVAASTSLNIYGPINIGATRVSVSSGSGEALILSSGAKTVSFYTGSMDDLRMWKKARTIFDVSSSFNVKQHAQRNLVGLWRFNCTGSAFEQEDNRIVVDSSGYGLNGRIVNYFGALRGSGSLLIQEQPDLVLNIGTPEVSEFITEQQASGSAYDRQNSRKITDLLPEKFFVLEDVEFGTELLKNFLYVMARHYDKIKLHIDQFVNVLTVKYGEYDQAPDALMDMVAQFFGWEFTGNFLNADAFQYILGRNVLRNVEGNTDLEKKLFDIKNEFWRRVLINLMYIYKSKGTRESIRSLLRCYGINDGFVRIKEFGAVPVVGIQTNRIKAEKSVSVLSFGSGSFNTRVTGSMSAPLLSGSWTVEMRVKFPLTSSVDFQPTRLTGSLWTIATSGGLANVNLSYQKDSLGSFTGSLILSSSDVTNLVILSGAGIFNNEWYNVATVMDDVSSSLSIQVRHLDEDEVDLTLMSSTTNITGGLALTGTFRDVSIGFHSGTRVFYSGEMWAQEFRCWRRELVDEELDDHTLNFQSYGLANTVGHEHFPALHWRLDDDVTASAGGIISPIRTPLPNGPVGVGVSFVPSVSSFDRFLNDYNYIASMDFGWSEDKVRIFDSFEVPLDRAVEDAKVVSVEFNLMDALNEDISQIYSSLEELNEKIGSPVNKHRVYYDELEITRNIYFKRLQGRLNFTVFSNLLDFFDRSFIDMVRRLIPARAHFMGDEFVVESHMLERPKVTYERRFNQETQFVPEGRIEIWSRFGRNDDGSGRKFPLLLSGTIKSS